MLRKTKELLGCRLAARDGEIGRLKDFDFDDLHWTVRYLVADTGGWLFGRQVLISPFAVGKIDSPHPKAIEVNLTKKQIEESPSIETHKPVSRQYEEEYHAYFGWPTYWGGGQMASPDPFATGLVPLVTPPPIQKKSGDPHLRSTNELSGYHIQALDQEFGHVDDFVIDDHDWVIRYLVVDTKKWWHGKRVLLSPEWISSMSWEEARVYIDLDAETVKRSPECDPSQPIDRKYEVELYSFYNRPPYWEQPREMFSNPS